MSVISYALEQLFVDQDRDWVIDTIAPVIAWVPGVSGKRSKSRTDSRSIHSGQVQPDGDHRPHLG